MTDVNPYIFLYSANFAFILTNLYGWILKVFYKAEPYRDNYDNLFPSQKINAALYLLQIFEIPYLLMIGEPKALFYVNAFAILIFSSLMVVMVESYFFLKKKTAWQYICYFLPVTFIVGYLLIAALEVIPTTPKTYKVIFWVVTIVFLFYIANLVKVQRKLNRNIRKIDEKTYSNVEDFPLRYAKRIEWVPITICVLMYSCFVFNDAYVKMWRDVLFTVVNVWFLIYNLNPRRKAIKPDAKQDQELEQILTGGRDSSKYKLTEERCKELEEKLIEMIEQEKIYLDSHLTVDQISKKLNTNRNYISEVIVRSDYGSFYTLVNFYRLKYAEEMLRRDPKIKIEHVAFDSGFSSVSVFSQVFKRYRGVSPSAFTKSLSSK